MACMMRHDHGGTWQVPEGREKILRCIAAGLRQHSRLYAEAGCRDKRVFCEGCFFGAKTAYSEEDYR